MTTVPTPVKTRYLEALSPLRQCVFRAACTGMEQWSQNIHSSSRSARWDENPPIRPTSRGRRRLVSHRPGKPPPPIVQCISRLPRAVEHAVACPGSELPVIGIYEPTEVRYAWLCLDRQGAVGQALAIPGRCMGRDPVWVPKYKTYYVGSSRVAASRSIIPTWTRDVDVQDDGSDPLPPTQCLPICTCNPRWARCLADGTSSSPHAGHPGKSISRQFRVGKPTRHRAFEPRL